VSIDPRVDTGHVHLKEADISRALAFWHDVLTRTQTHALFASGDLPFTADRLVVEIIRRRRLYPLLPEALVSAIPTSTRTRTSYCGSTPSSRARC
jgi:hypothetical protein